MCTYNARALQTHWVSTFLIFMCNSGLSYCTFKSKSIIICFSNSKMFWAVCKQDVLIKIIDFKVYETKWDSLCIRNRNNKVMQKSPNKPIKCAGPL